VLATIQLLLPTEGVRERFATMFHQAGRNASDLENMFVWVCRECVRRSEAGFPDPTAMMVNGSVHMVIQSGFELDRLTPGDAALASIFRARDVVA